MAVNADEYDKPSEGCVRPRAAGSKNGSPLVAAPVEDAPPVAPLANVPSLPCDEAPICTLAPARSGSRHSTMTSTNRRLWKRQFMALGS
jgi:hypothetical protein